MVIIETALIGGAAYGAYRGGEKAAHVGGRKIEDLKREGRRREDQRGFSVKQKERSTRLSQIQDRIQAAKTGGTAAAATSTSSSSNTTTAITQSTSNSSSSDHEERLQQERLQSIKERYSSARGGKPVTSGLSSSTTNNKKKKGVFGMFGKKK